MEIMEFCQKVKRNLADYMGDTVTITIKQITKNNGIVFHSIIITEKEKNISPNIYLDRLYEEYENGRTFRAVMDEILSTYKECKIKENLDMGFFMDYEKMKEKVLYKIISYEKNKELLLQVPCIPVLDMAIVFYCILPQEELGNATILIYNNHLKMWGITKEQLHQDALKNTERIMPAKILTMEDVVREIFVREAGMQGHAAEVAVEQIRERTLDSVTEWERNGGMFILGNERKLFGAATMFYGQLLEKIAEKIDKNLFVLPSSIHEVILIPDDERQDGEELWKMVCEINATQVEPEEVLTDSVYYFSRKTKRLEKLF